MDSPDHEHRTVVEYFLGQSPSDATVVHAEKVSSESVFGRRHDVWDVHSSGRRWWVITDPMNLYAHESFPSMDVALSFHIGLMARVAARQSARAPDGPRHVFVEAWRRWEQAGSSIEAAFEIEDYQAVGMRCREALIAFVEDAQLSLENHNGIEPPKAADFVGWSGILARALAPGKSAERVRGHLETISRSTWQLVQWLTHAKGASRADAHLAFDATGNVLAAYCTAVLRAETERRCPACSSAQLADNYDPTGATATTICVACGYRSEPFPLHDDVERGEETVERGETEGDCVFVEKPLYGPKLSDMERRSALPRKPTGG